MTPLSGWQNFYVIVGSSAGALIGLQFVVMTLISDLPAVRNQEEAGAAFATPTIVHFSAVLLLAAIQCAPWQQGSNAAIAWGLLGLSGVVYQFVVVRKMHTQNLYKPVWEDWLFHTLLPFVSYSALAVSTLLVRWDQNVTLFVVASSALVLLFVGIHNAWDAVTYHVYSARKRSPEKTQKS